MLIDTWASRIRFVYIGETTSCDIAGNTWLHKEVHEVGGKSSITNLH